MGKSGRCRFLESWNLWTCLLGSLYCSDLSFGVVGCKNAEKGCISIREYSKIYEKVISQVVQTPQQPVFQSKDGDAGMYKLWIRFWNNASLLYWSFTCVCIIFHLLTYTTTALSKIVATDMLTSIQISFISITLLACHRHIDSLLTL